MDPLNGMEVFVRVADALSLSTAARQLEVTPSAISKVLSKLEARLGVQLLTRTTRQVRLTDAGRIYLERSRRILAAVKAAEQLTMQPAATSQVTLACPPGVFRDLLQPRLSALVSQPRLSLALDLRDAADGADVVVRTVPAGSSERPLGSVRYGLYASPVYLERRGAPLRPQDLERHDCLLVTSAEPVLRMRVGGRLVAVPISCRVRASSDDALRELALRGLGIARLTHSAAAEAVRHRQLAPVLDSFELEPYELTVEASGGESAQVVREWVLGSAELAGSIVRRAAEAR